MNPVRAALAAALVTVVAVVAVVVALSSNREAALSGLALPQGVLSAAEAPAAPELAGISHFDNTEPLTLAGLRGRVVLVDFWTYTCINCRRTFPFLRALQQTYPELTVLGVHSPEFGFEKSHDNVVRAIQELDVTWPVAEDPEMITWRAFNNQYWPAKYLIDQSGKVRYAHFGEGDEDQTERAVRTLLAEGGGQVPPAIGERPATTGPADGLTPETYFGSVRGAPYVASGKVVAPGTTARREDAPAAPGHPRAHVARSAGRTEYLELGAGASVTQRFRARDLYVTAGPGDRPVTLEVTLDGKPVPGGPHGDRR